MRAKVAPLTARHRTPVRPRTGVHSFRAPVIAGTGSAGTVDLLARSNNNQTGATIMASTTDMAPNRTAAKTPARRAANGPRRAAARQSRSREDELSEQVHQLQSDLKSIASTLATLAEDKVSDAQ